MRPGPLEIIIILAVIVAIIILARMFRARPAPPQESKSTSNAWGIFRRLGVVLIIVGIVYFVGAIGVFEMLGWALRSYLWALPAIILGIVLVIISHRR